MHQPRHQGRDEDRPEERAAAVAFLERRADHQDHHHVADVVGVARVPEHMQHKARVGAQIVEGRAVDAEQDMGAAPAGEAVEEQNAKAQDGKAQHHRGIILDADAAAPHFSASNAARAAS